jgi:phosphoserine phosphatase
MLTALTLVCNPSTPALTPGLIAAARQVALAAGLREAAAPRSLREGVAADLIFDGPAADPRAVADAVRFSLAPAPIDVIAQPAATRRKRLLIADMDSTIIGQECLDELADFAGLKAEISAITERAMRGELDFEAALLARVGMLKGLTEARLQETFDQRVTLNPGAKTLVQTMRQGGAMTALVSGGFTFFTERVAAAAGFAAHRANRLLIADGALTGDARPILGRAAKEDALLTLAAAAGLALSETLAVGDGANDLSMLARAGLGVAYRAKPAVAAAAAARIEHADLTALLYAQGIPASEFVDD